MTNKDGMIDGMAPASALITAAGETKVVYLTKSPTEPGRNKQEIHLLKLRTPPYGIVNVYHTRTPFSTCST